MDIALIKLASPVPLNRAVNVVCLPSASDQFPVGTECLTAGWGHTEEGAAHAFSVIFIYVQYVIVIPRRYNMTYCVRHVSCLSLFRSRDLIIVCEEFNINTTHIRTRIIIIM